MTKHPILYKKTSHGKTQEWSIEQDGASYRSISGQSDGKKTTSEWTKCKGKNIGRSNETSDIQQCTSEIESLYRKKLDSTYTKSISEVTAVHNAMFQPMLANKFEDYYPTDNIPRPDIKVGIQAKLDGIRCNITKDRSASRKNKDFVTIPHIRQALVEFFKKYPDIVLDGELYNHEFKADFNSISSIVKKQKPSVENLAESAEFIQYWIYDFYDPTRPNMTFTERMKFLVDTFGKNTATDKCLILTPTYINIIKSVKLNLEKFLADGYEGAMVRNLHSVYQQKRTKDLLKYKIFTEEEFIITDIIEGKGNLTGCAASVECTAVNGESFNAGIMGNREYIRELWKNRTQVIGMQATIKYFNLTPDGIPRFGKMKTIRDYE